MSKENSSGKTGKLLIVYIDKFETFVKFKNKTRTEHQSGKFLHINIDYIENEIAMLNYFAHKQYFRQTTDTIGNILFVPNALKSDFIKYTDMNTTISYWNATQELTIKTGVNEFIDKLQFDMVAVNNSKLNFKSFNTDRNVQKQVEAEPKIEPKKTLFVFVPNNQYYIKFQEYLYYVDLICSDDINRAETQELTNENCQSLLLIRHNEYRTLDAFLDKRMTVEHFKTRTEKIDRVIFINYSYDRIFQKLVMSEILKVSNYIIASPVDTPEMTMMVIKKQLDKANKKQIRLKTYLNPEDGK